MDPAFGSVSDKVALLLAYLPTCRTWKTTEFSGYRDIVTGLIHPDVANELPSRYYLFNLIMDNNGLTILDEDFRTNYINDDDSYLKAAAPKDMYIAKPLG